MMGRGVIDHARIGPEPGRNELRPYIGFLHDETDAP